jgi:hypothetical protein
MYTNIRIISGSYHDNRGYPQLSSLGRNSWFGVKVKRVAAREVKVSEGR